MIKFEEIKNYLLKSPVQDLTLGYRQVHFIKPENLEDEQFSFTHHFNGLRIANSGEGSWSEDWTVIATDEIGAPVFIDRTTGFIYTAIKEDEKWQLYRVANSIQLYYRFIEIMSKLVEGRETPEDFRVNPIPEPISDAIMIEIEKHSADCDIWYWELFLEDLWQNPEQML